MKSPEIRKGNFRLCNLLRTFGVEVSISNSLYFQVSARKKFLVKQWTRQREGERRYNVAAESREPTNSNNPAHRAFGEPEVLASALSLMVCSRTRCTRSRRASLTGSSTTQGVQGSFVFVETETEIEKRKYFERKGERRAHAGAHLNILGRVDVNRCMQLALVKNRSIHGLAKSRLLPRCHSVNISVSGLNLIRFLVSVMYTYI